MPFVRRVLTSLALTASAVRPAGAQAHPVGSEWACAACSGGQVCYRERVELTTCRVPNGQPSPNPTPATMQAWRQALAAQITAATARIQQNPRDANAWVSRGAYYLTPSPGGLKPPLENAEAAVRDLETAIKIDPRNYYARHNYAHAAYLLGYQNFAIDEFNKALAINPNAARSYLGRGWSYYEECKVNEAGADFARTVQLDASLQGKVVGPQGLQRRKQQCVEIAAELQRLASQPPPRTSMPDVGRMYERNEAIGRANRADAEGDHGTARIIREQAGVP